MAAEDSQQDASRSVRLVTCPHWMPQGPPLVGAGLGTAQSKGDGVRASPSCETAGGAMQYSRCSAPRLSAQGCGSVAGMASFESDDEARRWSARGTTVPQIAKHTCAHESRGSRAREKGSSALTHRWAAMTYPILTMCTCEFLWCALRLVTCGQPPACGDHSLPHVRPGQRRPLFASASLRWRQWECRTTLLVQSVLLHDNSSQRLVALGLCYSRSEGVRGGGRLRMGSDLCCGRMFRRSGLDKPAKHVGLHLVSICVCVCVCVAF